MGLRFEIPGAAPLEIEHLLLDVNGTLTHEGKLVPGVSPRLRSLDEDLDIRLVSSDTLGTMKRISETLGIEATRVDRGERKKSLVEELGPERCAAIGNGANDALMLDAAALGIAVLGAEGAAVQAMQSADLTVPSINAGLDLLLDPASLASTLRP